MRFIEIHHNNSWGKKDADQVAHKLEKKPGIYVDIVRRPFTRFKVIVDGVTIYKLRHREYLSSSLTDAVNKAYSATVNALEDPGNGEGHEANGPETKETLSSALEVKDPIALYAVYRDYLKHEDELINRRLSWNLTLQGFLFAAYGFSLTSRPAPVDLNDPTVKDAIKVAFKETMAHLTWLRIVFPSLGILISAQSWIGVVAAQDAIDALKFRWSRISSPFGVGAAFPSLTGGGRLKANRLGKVAQWIPGTIIVGWAAIFAYGWPTWLRLTVGAVLAGYILVRILFSFFYRERDDVKTETKAAGDSA